MSFTGWSPFSLSAFEMRSLNKKNVNYITMISCWKTINNIGCWSSSFSAVESISNLRGGGGYDTSRRALFPEENGAFPENKRAVLWLLQNLGGTCPQCPRFLRLRFNLVVVTNLRKKLSSCKVYQRVKTFPSNFF